MVQHSKLICILLSTLLINMSMTLIAPLYPIIANSRGISEVIIGLIFTMCPLFSCASSLCIGKKIEKLGKRNTACIGIITNALSLLCFSFVNSLDNMGFIVLSLFARAISGFGVACIYISNLSLITMEFPEKRESYTSMMEAFGGLGLVIAPLYVTFSYELIGFSGGFFIICLLLVFFLPVYWMFTVPSRVVVPSSTDEAVQDRQMRFTRNMITDWTILVYCYSVLTFLEPTISIYLSGKGISDNEIGLVFSGMTMGYTATNFLMSWLTKYFRPERILPMSVVVCAVGMLLAGPLAEIFDMVSVCIAGVILTGCGVGISFVSVLPSMLNEAQKARVYNKQSHGDLASYFSMGMNMGEIMGPLLSGMLVVFFGFSNSCILFLGVAFMLFIAFLMKSKECNKEAFLVRDSPEEIYK